MATEISSRSRSEEAIARLRGALRGPLIQPGDPEYDAARAVYNGMIDKHPALIVRCRDVADVIAAVNFAREQEMLLAVRGGGHNGAGLGTCDDGMVVDLSPMRSVRVDPVARTVRVGGGCTLGDVDHATQPFGLAVPSGINSTTGMSGLTLGGGIGHLTRPFGLSIDSLLEADVVLADGSFVTASAEQHPDLFWAIRGGGGNFGVVTSFLFLAHPVGMVTAGPTLWELGDSSEVLRWYREFIPNAPRELNGIFAFLRVPPYPPYPEELHGRTMCGVIWCYAGPEETAKVVLEPALNVGKPVAHLATRMPLSKLQSAADALYPPGDQWYWKADFFQELSDETIAIHEVFGAKVPSLQSRMHIFPIDGTAHDTAPHATAWSYRDARWATVIAGVGKDPAQCDTLRTWARTYWEALHPFSAGGAYINMMMDEGEGRVRAAYRGNYDRLARIKATYDPSNLFRVNQNIRPGTSSRTP